MFVFYRIFFFFVCLFSSSSFLHVGLFQVEGMEGSMDIANDRMGTDGSVHGRDGWRLRDRGWRKPSDQSSRVERRRSVGGRDGWRLRDRGWRKPSDQS